MKSKEIAKALDISEATVSLALNKRPGVSAKTVERIQKYIIDNDKPKEIENHKRINKDKTIMVVHYFKNGWVLGDYGRLGTEDGVEKYESGKASKINNHYRLLLELEKIVEVQGFQFANYFLDRTRETEERLIQTCRERKGVGIYILAAEMEEEDIYPFLELNIPIIVGDNKFYTADIDSYNNDSYQGVQLCIDYLRSKGHRHILYLSSGLPAFNFEERRNAFVRLMKKNHMGDASNRIYETGAEYNEAYQRIQRLLYNGVKNSTAFICECPAVTIGTVKALFEGKYRIPKDFSLIGFDPVIPESIGGLHLTMVKGAHMSRHIEGVKYLIRKIQEKELQTITVNYRMRVIEGNTVFNKLRYTYL